MKIYTRGGDRGETGLLGGERVPKSDLRVAAYGSVDELNAGLGLALALDEEDALDRRRLEGLQEDLLAIGARLAAVDPQRAARRGTIPALDPSRVERLERWIDRLDEELPTLDAFILPGGSPLGAQLHVTRTVCRRAERAIVELREAGAEAGEVDPELDELVIPYVNRLSDLLFTLARAVNHRLGTAEARWAPQRERRDGSGEEVAG